jgi:hypothetical protein
MAFFVSFCNSGQIQPEPQQVTISPDNIGLGSDLKQSAVDSALVDAPPLPLIPPSDTLTILVQFHTTIGIADSIPYQELNSYLQNTIKTANSKFGGYLKYVADTTVYVHNIVDVSIYDLFDKCIYEKEQYNEWVNAKVVDSDNEDRVVTVFILPTFAQDGSKLLGFCPVLTGGFDLYQRFFEIPQLTDNVKEKYEPNFEHLFVSLDGIVNGRTMSHEFGHFFGLGHVPDLDSMGRVQQGVVVKTTRDSNIMGGLYPTDFTREQLGISWQFATTYRPYILH